MDYDAIGFRAGLECHQQLSTSEKLFCHCSTERSENFPIKVTRKIRAVAGELGKVDKAARFEHARERAFVYHGNPETCCLLELDECPPFPINQEALKTTLEVSLLFDADIIDEMQVMRKSIVNGSCVSAFQRTLLAAVNGFVETSKGKVRIPTIQLEEDAATPIKEEGNIVHYRLDRLGVPLIELGTAPDIKDPNHLKETALRIGALLRATSKVKRGIGSIRQDINISIRDGARTEIKGVQEPSMFPLIAEREVQRQLALLEVRRELRDKETSVGEVQEVTSLFEDSRCKFMRKAECVMALALPGFKGILGKEVQPGRRVGTELSDYVKTAGVGGIIHSDEELRDYHIQEEKVREKMGLSEEDAFVLVASSPGKARRALELVSRRAQQLGKGIPQEVRKALPDGNTSYLRPMPGAARLYPETDVPPILITEERLKRVKKPEKPEKTKKKLLKKGLSEDLAEKLVSSPELALFKKIKSEDPALVASILEDTLTALKRDGYDVDSLEDHHFVELFRLYDEGIIAKESIPSILGAMTLNPGKPVEQLIEDLGFKKMSEGQVREKISKIIEKNEDALKKRNAFNILMGEVMKELRGKADGGLIAKLVKQEIQEEKEEKKKKN